MRRRFTFMSCLTLLALAGAPAAPAQQTQTVETQDNRFVPATFTVRVGDTIVFKNTGVAPHTATAKDGSFDTGNLNPGEEKPVTITRAGTISLFCIYHETLGMVGTITAQAAGGASPTPTAASPSPQASPSPAETSTPAGSAQGSPSPSPEPAGSPAAVIERQPTEKYLPPLAIGLFVLLLLVLGAAYMRTLKRSGRKT